MSNRYWRKRIAEEMEQAQKRDMNRQREMQRLYDEALEELQLTIDGLFQRYANKEGLNLAQAKKRASAMDLNIFNRRVKRWVEERDFSPEANKHLKLYNLKGKVSRLELMKQHMKLATAQLAGREEAYVRESLHDEAVRQREIQSGIFGLYAPDSDQFRQQANAIINTPFQGGSWSKRIWERQNHLANFLNSAIQRIIMQGKHSTTFQSEVRKKFNSTAYEAKRLLVTETARVQTEVQRQTMEDNGFSQYEYMAEPTACHICKPLDGQIFKVSDMEPGTNAAPMHPNCKCSSAPYESREDLEDMFDAIAEGRGDEFFAGREAESEAYSSDYDVNFDRVTREGLTYRFKDLPFLSDRASDNFARASLHALQHRTGTSYEDYYLMTKDGKQVAVANSSSVPKRVSYTKQIYDAFEEYGKDELVSIHNHPSGFPPSIADIASLNNKDKQKTVKYGIVVGHDGTMYWYTRPKSDIPKEYQQIYKVELDKLRKIGYNEITVQEKALERASDIFGFEFGRF